MKNTLKKVIAGLAIAALFSPFLASAQTTADLQLELSTLLAQVQQLQARLSQLNSGGTGQFCFYFNNNIGVGTSGGDVGPLVTALSLQSLINPPANTSNIIYDETLASAVSAFQEKYRSEILAPSGLTAGTGYVGVATRAKLNSLYGCNGATNPPPSSSLNISYLTPSSGPVGTQVTITGNGFTSNGNRISFGTTGNESNPNYNLNSYDGRTLTFTVPSSNYYSCQSPTPACYPANYLLQPGVYAVSVTNSNGVTNSLNFTITSGGSPVGVTPTYGAPVISSISPTVGSRGSEVTILGSNFTPSDSVQFSDMGTYMAHNYVSSTALTFTVPSSLSNCSISGTSCTNFYGLVTNGPYNIRVINGSGTSNAVPFTVIGY